MDDFLKLECDKEQKILDALYEEQKTLNAKIQTQKERFNLIVSLYEKQVSRAKAISKHGYYHGGEILNTSAKKDKSSKRRGIGINLTKEVKDICLSDKIGKSFTMQDVYTLLRDAHPTLIIEKQKVSQCLSKLVSSKDLEAIPVSKDNRRQGNIFSVVRAPAYVS